MVCVGCGIGQQAYSYCSSSAVGLRPLLRQNCEVELDGSVRIAWQTDGFEAIHVYARFWPSTVVSQRAQVVAEVALINRTVNDLRRILRERFGGGFELQAPDEDAPDKRVAIFFDPPRGTPNPDEYL